MPSLNLSEVTELSTKQLCHLWPYGECWIKTRTLDLDESGAPAIWDNIFNVAWLNRSNSVLTSLYGISFLKIFSCSGDTPFVLLIQRVCESLRKSKCCYFIISFTDICSLRPFESVLIVHNCKCKLVVVSFFKANKSDLLSLIRSFDLKLFLQHPTHKVSKELDLILI